MSLLLKKFFSAELTSIPRIIDKYIGKYYNNTVTNGVTWTFFIWTILHIWFDKSVDVLLKRMAVKEYVRQRLLNSIWLCGFCGTSFFYCLGTLMRNNVDVISYRSSLTTTYGYSVPGYLMLGFMLITGFFLHELIYESLQEVPVPKLVNYLSILVLVVYAYMSRRIELYLSIVAISSFTKFITEVSSTFIAFLKPKTIQGNKVILDIILCVNIIVITCTHIVLTTIMLLYPLAFLIYKHQQSYSILILNILLLLWTTTEVINSPLFKFVNHWINHENVTNQRICCGNRIECAFFVPRDDLYFNMRLIKRGIVEREFKMKEMQKPKHRGLLAQTLKCIGVLKIKKKVHESRMNKALSESLIQNKGDVANNPKESSSSDSDSDC